MDHGENIPQNGPAEATSVQSARRNRRLNAVIVLASLLTGVAVRICLIISAPERGFLMDHLHFMAWSDWVAEHGITSIYDFPEHRLLNVRLPATWGYGDQPTPFPVPEVCNYPPAATCIFWAQGRLWHLVDAEVRTLPVGQELAAYKEFAGRHATSRVANTVSARAVNAVIPVFADVLLAWGVLRLVRSLGEPQSRRWTAPAAFAITFLAPPFVLNTGLWMQLDSCLTCLLVWTICFIVERRPVWAGIACGAALLLKAQAILLCPTLVIVAVSLLRGLYVKTVPAKAGPSGLLVGQQSGPPATSRAGRDRLVWYLHRFIPALALTAALLVAPHAIANRDHPEGGWLRWYRRGYALPIGEQFPLTTLKAFNVWWLDFLVRGDKPEALAPATIVWPGLTKGEVGALLYGATLVLAAWLCLRRWSHGPLGWVAYAGLSLLAAFVFPTRVHERYFSYSLPFLIAAATNLWRWMPVLAVLLAVGSFEMTWYLWLAPADAPPETPPQSVNAAWWSAVLAALTLGSFAYACISLLPGFRQQARE